MRTTPLMYFKESASFVVVGSDGGAKRDPQWWKNLQVNEERGNVENSLWDRYQQKTERSIPVVVLDPVA